MGETVKLILHGAAYTVEIPGGDFRPDCSVMVCRACCFDSLV